MRNLLILFCIFNLLVLASGCADTQTKSGEGAIVGGILGAGAGGIIGHQTHDTAAGMLIGGAIGAAGGALVGSQMPKEPQVQYRPYEQPISQITMQQIVDWSKQGMSSDEIISRIRTTNSNYSLTGEDVNFLRKQGVSQRVVEAMQATR